MHTCMGGSFVMSAEERQCLHGSLYVNTSSGKDITRNASFVPVLILSLLYLALPVASQGHDDTNIEGLDPKEMEGLSTIMLASFDHDVKEFKAEIQKLAGFCVADVDADVDRAFNFSKDPTFIQKCNAKIKGDVRGRICNVAEMMAFWNASMVIEEQAKTGKNLKPNTNCNLDSWVSGCEPGWACALSPDETNTDLKEKKRIPMRTQDCEPCCEGFFSPQGITCMMPCPLGAYCPAAEYTDKTNACSPYKYQLPPGDTNHTCGGADQWLDIQTTKEIFCSAGAYCPTPVQETNCSEGYFCRIGSTRPDKCWSLAKCDPSSETQNITVYGALVFAVLSVTLIVLYNYSDRALATREKREEESREKAVQTVRENAEVEGGTWKSFARRSAVGLQTQFSRTFSRRNTAKPGKDNQSKSGASSGVPPVPQHSEERKKGKSKLTTMINEIENDPESHNGFNVKIGDKDIKKNVPKSKDLQTKSAIFRYAYGQIEKEKAMQERNKNLTYSRVISLGKDIELKTRPPVEVAFNDLTLTLKGTDKRLMRYVTGKLSPGRVTAVMGPSGAGKTTFLSAVCGKATGCSVMGAILVNGRPDPIQSYKKIVGFVPQDDVVHGNLTVEENLWFSARCRLAANLPVAEKVLIVERVIECLGLQAVRHSLVGTVEKRGISGGQKKRVNVGLEMVIEPSLLVLDEPTSGLDSTSSSLLLRALRREALEGVNVCLVVHQPSYSLFRMFDELVLLAKGGLMVYHGPIKKLEEYFANLGITVPDRVNPPDYLIDILEGIIKPNTTTGVTCHQLPVRWMLHNGYSVPLDMLESEEIASVVSEEGSEKEANYTDAVTQEPSFAGDLWNDVKTNVGVIHDKIQRNFFQSRDLSNRRTPGVFVQYRYFLGRVGKQRLRESRTDCMDYLVLLLAGVIIGTIAKLADETFGGPGYTYTVIAVSLLCKIAALRSFSLDMLHYWRESASGMSSMAYFLSKDTIDLFNVLLKPILYLSMFYYFNNPRSTLLDNYVVLLCLVYCVTGIAYILAIVLEPGPAQLWSVILPVVLTLVASQGTNDFVLKLSKYCFTRWALEAFLVLNAKRYHGVWLISRCGLLYRYHYDIRNFGHNLLSLVLTGLATRILAYICLLIVQKK